MILVGALLVATLAVFQLQFIAARTDDVGRVKELGSQVELSKSSLSRKSPLSLILKRKLAFQSLPSLNRMNSLKRLNLPNVLKVRKESARKGWPFEKVEFSHPIQSPVDVITSKAVTKKLPLLDIIEPSQLQNVKAKFYNSGSTVYVTFEEEAENRPYLIGGPLDDKYIFEQMHIHWGTEDLWGSEHFVDGESFGSEIHMVYYNSKYSNYDTAHDKEEGLAVLAIFAEATNENNPLLDPLYNRLGEVTKAKSSVFLDSSDAMQWAASALTLNTEYYTYPGSLTTKPYSENVVFIILPKPIELSHQQLEAFRSIEDVNKTCITANKRKLQPLHNRPIVRGTDMQ